MSSGLDLSFRFAVSGADVRACHQVMSQLRPGYDEGAFVAAMAVQRIQGYHLAVAELEGKVVAAAGIRVQHSLHRGHHAYVDDLVTDEAHRSKGIGAAFFEWLERWAKAQGCQTLELGSGTERLDAHRLYAARGMDVASFHFRLRLPDD